MAPTKKLIGAAAFSLALAGGGAAGALLGTPGSSGAQESTTTTTVPAADADRHGGGWRRGAVGLSAAAEAIGITADELRTELEAGKTIADVAEAHDVDVDTVIDAIVADATVNLRERVTEMVNGQLPLRGEHGPFGEKLEAAATALGVTVDELRTALQGGQSIADVAAANGVDVQTVIDALVAAGIPADRATEIVNHDGPFFRGGHGPRP